MAETKNKDHAQRLGTLQKMGVATMDRALSLYMAFLLGLLGRPSIILTMLTLVSLYVLLKDSKQKTQIERRRGRECPKVAVG